MSESLCGYCFKEYAPSCCEKSEYENVKRQLAEARGLIAKVKADLISIQDITSDPITSLQLGACIKKLKEKGDE